MKKIITIVLALVLLVTFWASPVAASTSTYQARFGAIAHGPSVAAVGPLDINAEYVKPAFSTFIFGGTCSVEEPVVFDGVTLYPVEPGTVEAQGFLAASWTYGGVSYEVRVRLYATSDTQVGILIPEGGYIIFGGSESQPNPLAYNGVLKVGAVQQDIEGECGLTVVPGAAVAGTEAKLTVVKLNIGEVQSITFLWSDESGTLDIPTLYDNEFDIEAARAFQNRVMVRTN